MTRPSLALRRTPLAGLLALALAAPVAATAGPAAAAAPLERAVVQGADAAAAVRAAGGRVLAPLPLVDGVDALLPAGVRPPGLQVTPDRPLSVAAARTAGSGETSTVRATLGLGAPAGEGRGVTVAVVDTGVADLPDLDGRVQHVAVPGVGTGDGLGHGTFIAGLVASSGASTGGATAGVAPAASVLDVKVADAAGTTSLADVLRGLQLVQAHGDVDVVNLSLSSGSPLPSALDPLAVALGRLWSEGTVVVVPSGNDPQTVSSPGADPLLLTVGGLADSGTAARDDDAVAVWSGRSVRKPDLVAPGQSLVSLLAPGSEAARAQTSTGLPDGHGRGSGTSFATAVTAGAAAVLLAERPALRPGQVKHLLTRTAYRGGAALTPSAGAGAGGLDLAAALGARTPAAAAHDVPTPLPAGDLADWERFAEAMVTGDADTAASSWSLLSPQARHWVARHWVSVDPQTREWEARHWVARHWVVDGWTEQEWLARHWVARHWVARHWVDEDWQASSWSARHWVARHWTALDTSTDGWSARHWTARHWTARHWTARHWTTASWS